MVKTRKLNKMGRRRFLNTLSGLGVSAATLNYMTKDALAETTDNPKKEVPRLLGLVHTNHEKVVSENAVPKREPKFYTISRDEWAETEATHEAAARLGKAFGSEPHIDASVSTRGGEFGISIKYVEVEHVDGSVSSPNIPLEKVKERTPTRTTGKVQANGKEYVREKINVKVTKTSIKEQANFDSEFRPVPAGCQAEVADAWTIGTPATSLDDNSQCWVTAAHCINRTSQEVVHQPENRWYGSNYETKIGESRKYTEKGNGDIATVVSTDPDNAYNIADNDGTYGWQVSGVLGRDKLKDMQSNNQNLYQQGRTTGRNTGTILDVDTTGVENVYLDVDTDGGDSGGPYFHVESDDLALIAGIHRAAVDPDKDENFDEAVGNIMAWAEEELNVVV